MPRAFTNKRVGRKRVGITNIIHTGGKKIVYKFINPGGGGVCTIYSKTQPPQPYIKSAKNLIFSNAFKANPP